LSIVAPRKPCTRPGCRQFQPCPRHPKNSYDDNRPSAAKRGYGHRWRVYCEGFKEQHPICEFCGVKQTTDVEHTIAVAGPEDPLFWEPSNHRGACHGCHSRKTVQQDGGFGRM
jgi:5-methylcytosine-specific restriction enzyme A